MGATYTAAAAASSLAGLSVRDSSVVGIGIILVVASAALATFGETLRRRQPAVHAFFGFAGVAGATIPLYLLGSNNETASIHLDILGGIIASVALLAGVAIPRAGIAYGAVVGLAGLVLDIGLRNFHTSTSIGVFLTVFGAAVIGALVAVSALMRARGK